jgi:hypothetical protein
MRATPVAALDRHRDLAVRPRLNLASFIDRLDRVRCLIARRNHLKVGPAGWLGYDLPPSPFARGLVNAPHVGDRHIEDRLAAVMPDQD